MHLIIRSTLLSSHCWIGTFWFGAVLRNSEIYWKSDRSTASYYINKIGGMQFLPAQPDNSGGAEDCICMSSSGELIDQRCSSKFSFLCERPFGKLVRDCIIFENFTQIHCTFDNERNSIFDFEWKFEHKSKQNASFLLKHWKDKKTGDFYLPMHINVLFSIQSSLCT